MKKSKFIKSTIILLIGGFLTKILGMLLKIILTRKIGTKTLGLYMLIIPTFNLFITLCQAGFPISISKLVAEDRKNNKKIVFSSIFMSLIITFILMIILILISPFISSMLHNEKLKIPIICISFTLPFISISSIIRGYFFGKENMIPHVVSNSFEQILRIIIYIILLPKIIAYGEIFTICFIVLTNILSELFSILILYFFLPNKIKIKKEYIKPDTQVMKDVLNISIPTTSSRVIGMIGYFFEPIILTTFLLMNGYSNNYITYEYGILNGYIMPLLLLPSFFSMAISQSAIPVISNGYANKKIDYVKIKIKQSIFLSFFIGLIFTIFIMLFPKFCMILIYNTTEGINYIRVLAPFFLLFYIQGPIVSIMQSLNKSKDAFMSTFIGILIKISLMIVLTFLNMGIYSLIISTIVNIIYVTLFNVIKVIKIFK